MRKFAAGWDVPWGKVVKACHIYPLALTPVHFKFPLYLGQPRIAKAAAVAHKTATWMVFVKAHAAFAPCNAGILVSAAVTATASAAHACLLTPYVGPGAFLLPAGPSLSISA